MQTQTLEKSTVKIAPINEVAELIDREIHAKTLEQINVLAREYEIYNRFPLPRWTKFSQVTKM